MSNETSRVEAAAALADHFEEIAYADDIPEGQDWDVPEDYERHYCNEDGEDWPCRAVLAAATGGADG